MRMKGCRTKRSGICAYAYCIKILALWKKPVLDGEKLLPDFLVLQWQSAHMISQSSVPADLHFLLLCRSRCRARLLIYGYW